jgi:hypothetical protein
VFYFEHAARELPVDLILGVAVGGSAVFAFPEGAGAEKGTKSGRRRMLIAAAAAIIGTILVGTAYTVGWEALLNNLLQMHTRPGATLAWGAHWRYHSLSSAMLMLVSFGLAGVLIRGLRGREGTGSRTGQSIFAASLVVFAILTLVFVPDLDPFRDAIFLGHQVREAFTHLLVTTPMAWAACIGTVRDEPAISRFRGVSIRWSIVSGMGGVLIGVYLLAAGLLTSAASQGQTADLTMLLCPHFFEHTFTFAIVPVIAALVYQSAVANEKYAFTIHESESADSGVSYLTDMRRNK